MSRIPMVSDRNYNIHYYEVDIHKRALITSIIDYLGDMAMYQSEILGVGIEHLKENHMAWVLYKWDITMESYPLLNETIKVKTFAYSFRKFYAYRKHEIIDIEGNTIGYATSVWILINTDRRRPIRITEEMYGAYGIDDSNNTSIEIEDIKPINTVDSEKSFQVRYSDIDTNMHVNNVNYVAWALETVPGDVILNCELKNIKVTYEKETIYGETINVSTEVIREENKTICRHKIINEEGTQLTLLESTWI
ncbi:acyl-[acyl-carrier-protein] thioesterase [Clostridium tagluense]|uniref:acyl-[acyl-carrier-protein] thioesterase n=1 Tax=Clostridium tagluense TaxID=360422 RepID=UPI001C6E1BB4|nr:acyl-ACP thioesterase domain-containing protein [Clostridium tagluense]MBW9156067.1 acyl-ACP thioesterase [Clostridium tagluense]WLC65692.1 acyl-ACP thioesterase [Clostridium tagluense]